MFKNFLSGIISGAKDIINKIKNVLRPQKVEEMPDKTPPAPPEPPKPDYTEEDFREALEDIFGEEFTDEEFEEFSERMENEPPLQRWGSPTDISADEEEETITAKDIFSEVNNLHRKSPKEMQKYIRNMERQTGALSARMNSASIKGLTANDLLEI